MKISKIFLEGFVGGELYFRFPDFEKDRQCWFLFRSKILEIDVDQHKFGIIHEPQFLNRFIDTEGWVDHVLKHSQNINDIPFVFGDKLNFKMTSDEVAFAKVDNVAEILMFPPNFPHGVDPYKFFPAGYEVLYFAGSFL